jgi:hypothetical protein
MARESVRYSLHIRMATAAMADIIKDDELRVACAEADRQINHWFCG